MKVILILAIVAVLGVQSAPTVEKTAPVKSSDLLKETKKEGDLIRLVRQAGGREIASWEVNFEDGSSVKEKTFIVNEGTPDEDIVKMGEYSIYYPEENLLCTTAYTADKTGYHTKVLTGLSLGAAKSLSGK